jgi:glutaminyl-tRNA synthetase
MGMRKVPFSGTIYIERDDFMEDPPKKYFRLSPGNEVRLRYAYFIQCKDVIKDKNGNITELRCTYDPESKGGKSPDGRRVKGTIHWVSVQHAVEAEIRLYDRLFIKEDPTEVQEGGTFIDNLNPDSLRIVKGYTEPFARHAKPYDKFQFERLGYFCVDPDSDSGRLVFNRTVALRDSWARITSKEN